MDVALTHTRPIKANLCLACSLLCTHGRLAAAWVTHQLNTQRQRPARWV